LFSFQIIEPEIHIILYSYIGLLHLHLYFYFLSSSFKDALPKQTIEKKETVLMSPLLKFIKRCISRDHNKLVHEFQKYRKFTYDKEE